MRRTTPEPAPAEHVSETPISLVELRAELGERWAGLLQGIEPDTYTDDVGRRVVTRQLARQLIAERDRLEEKWRANTEAVAAANREISERNHQQIQAQLRAADAIQAKYGMDDPEATAPLAVMTAADREERLDERQALVAEFAARQTIRYDDRGSPIKEH